MTNDTWQRLMRKVLEATTCISDNGHTLIDSNVFADTGGARVALQVVPKQTANVQRNGHITLTCAEDANEVRIYFRKLDMNAAQQYKDIQAIFDEQVSA
jgi:hypothetical protein